MGHPQPSAEAVAGIGCSGPGDRVRPPDDVALAALARDLDAERARVDETWSATSSPGSTLWGQA